MSRLRLSSYYVESNELSVGYSYFSSYVGLDTASDVYTAPKISGISGIKMFETLATPKIIPILHRKYPLNQSSFMMTPKNIQKIFIPQKIFISLKIQNNLEIQDFEPPEIARAYVYMKVSECISPRECTQLD